MTPFDNRDEQRLDMLFRAYRDACPDPEPGPGFTPGLWQKIEARQSNTVLLGRWARNLAAAALAFSMVMGVYLSLPARGSFTAETYIEALADNNRSPDSAEIETIAFETDSAELL